MSRRAVLLPGNVIRYGKLSPTGENDEPEAKEVGDGVCWGIAREEDGVSRRWSESRVTRLSMVRYSQETSQFPRVETRQAMTQFYGG